MQTELAYVKEKLIEVGRAAWPKIAIKTKVSHRTLRRIVEGSLKWAPRSDNVGRIATYFRILEQRKAA